MLVLNACLVSFLPWYALRETARMGNVLDGLADHVTDKTTVIGESNSGSIRYAASEMKGWRDTMEDSHTLCTEIPVEGSSECLQDHSIFCVYDGHGGGFTSKHAGDNFVRIFSQRKAWKKYVTLPKDSDKGRGGVIGMELLKKALRGTFMALDDDLRTHQIAQNESLLCKLSNKDSNPAAEESELLQPLRIERSGSTIVVVLLTPSHVICANAGDSRAILRQGGRVLPLSFDHKPSNVTELERIVSAGGFVKGRRVDGDLAVSRGLGDFVFKSEESLPPHKQRVIAEPEFVTYPRDHTKDEFIVLACDGKSLLSRGNFVLFAGSSSHFSCASSTGIWDVLSNPECSNLVQEILDEGEMDLGLICEEVLDTCLEKNSRDNMTIVTVALPGIKIKNAKESSNAVWTRRAARKARILELQARIAAQNAGAGLGLDFGLMGESRQEETLAPTQSQKRPISTPVCS